MKSGSPVCQKVCKADSYPKLGSDVFKYIGPDGEGLQSWADIATTDLCSDDHDSYSAKDIEVLLSFDAVPRQERLLFLFVVAYLAMWPDA